MLEREMEDLVARYPDDFFPDKGFKLTGRQRSFSGVGRFDLMFEDRFKTNILMELKAVPAKYEVASQLAKYKDELQNRGESKILMWLVAPQIPPSVREFLDRIGIEYTEIHFVMFRRVAERHGVSTPVPTEVIAEPIRERPIRIDSARKKKQRAKEGVVSRSREFLRPAIYWLWDRQRDWVRRDQLIDELKQQAWAVEALGSDIRLDAEETRKRLGNWVDWLSANYESGLHGLKDEFERLKVKGTWAYRPLSKPPVESVVPDKSKDHQVPTY